MRDICKMCQRGYSFKNCRYQRHLRGTRCSHYISRYPEEISKKKEEEKKAAMRKKDDLTQQFELINEYQKKFPK